MKAFDRVKDIKEPWRFFKKITNISANEWKQGGGTPSVVVFIVLVQNFQCLRYLKEHPIFSALQRKSNSGGSAYRGVFASPEEYDSLIKDGKFGYALAMAHDSPYRAKSLEVAMMKMFVEEAKLLGISPNRLKMDMLPHLKLAVAYYKE